MNEMTRDAPTRRAGRGRGWRMTALFVKTRLGRRFELSAGRLYLMVQFRWRKP